MPTFTVEYAKGTSGWEEWRFGYPFYAVSDNRFYFERVLRIPLGG